MGTQERLLPSELIGYGAEKITSSLQTQLSFVFGLDTSLPISLRAVSSCSLHCFRAVLLQKFARKVSLWSSRKQLPLGGA